MFPYRQRNNNISGIKTIFLVTTHHSLRMNHLFVSFKLNENIYYKHNSLTQKYRRGVPKSSGLRV